MTTRLLTVIGYSSSDNQNMKHSDDSTSRSSFTQPTTIIETSIGLNELSQNSSESLYINYLITTTTTTTTSSTTISKSAKSEGILAGTVPCKSVKNISDAVDNASFHDHRSISTPDLDRSPADLLTAYLQLASFNVRTDPLSTERRNASEDVMNRHNSDRLEDVALIKKQLKKRLDELLYHSSLQHYDVSAEDAYFSSDHGRIPPQNVSSYNPPLVGGNHDPGRTTEYDHYIEHQNKESSTTRETLSTNMHAPAWPSMYAPVAEPPKSPPGSPGLGGGGLGSGRGGGGGVLGMYTSGSHEDNDYYTAVYKRRSKIDDRKRKPHTTRKYPTKHRSDRERHKLISVTTRKPQRKLRWKRRTADIREKLQ